MIEIKDLMRILSGNGMWHTDSLNGRVDTLFMSDGPHGLRAQNEKVRKNNTSCEATCFPTASALAASWDTELVAKVASAIADEAKAEGVSILLGPGVNIKRSPLCGRNFEYFSEDPYLAGKLAAAYINAVQEKGVGTSLKHFACNNQERYRMRQNSQVDDRTLNEIYLRAFEIAVKEARPATIMASYNRLNGRYSCMNGELLNSILRERWGFDGVVVSDWGACLDLTECVKAGMDLEMPGNSGDHLKKLKEDYENGLISDEEIRRAAERIIKLTEKYGESKAKPSSEEERKRLLKKNHTLAVSAAEECAVLLKNEGILPLKEGTKLTVLGDLAWKTRFQGGGSSHINTKSSKSFIEVLTETGTEFCFERGYDHGRNDVDKSLENKALSLAANADGPILFFGGLTDITEGEGYDRETLYMPDNQMSLLRKLKKLNKDLIFVSFGGSPYDTTPAEFAKAVLHMYLGGEGVNEAAYNLLFGKANPCGKLAETFPISIIDTPAYGNFATKNIDVCYNEGLLVGYRYYDSLGIGVKYPFGYGLSYTTFDYSDLKVEIDTENNSKVKIGFNITNTGNRAGKEISQVYIVNKKDRIMRPEKELRGFAKTELAPGEKRNVVIELDRNAFAFFDVNNTAFRNISGEYTVAVGSSSRDIKLTGKIYVNGKDWVDISGNAVKPHIMGEEEFAVVYARPLSRFSRTSAGKFDMTNSVSQLAKYSKGAKVLKAMVKGAGKLMYLGRSKDDPEVRMFMETVIDGPLDVIVCQSGGMIPMKLAKKIVEHANKKSLKKEKKK